MSVEERVEDRVEERGWRMSVEDECGGEGGG